MSSSHRLRGCPAARCAVLVVDTGSTCIARRAHLVFAKVITFCAHCHCFLLAVCTQLSMFSFRNCCSTCRVTLWIHSVHGSNTSSLLSFLSELGIRSSSSGLLVMSVPSSESLLLWICGLQLALWAEVGLANVGSRSGWSRSRSGNSSLQDVVLL